MISYSEESMSHSMTQHQALTKARELWGETAFVQRCVRANANADRWNRLRWPIIKFVVVGANGEIKGESSTWYCAFLAAGMPPQKI